jgi:hypothetical protein
MLSSPNWLEISAEDSQPINADFIDLEIACSSCCYLAHKPHLLALLARDIGIACYLKILVHDLLDIFGFIA